MFWRRICARVSRLSFPRAPRPARGWREREKKRRREKEKKAHSPSARAEYPFKHPQVKFETKIYHPNVNREDGSVCEEMLSANWSPQTQMREVLGKVYKMLEEPNADNPVDEEITQQFKGEYRVGACFVQSH